MRLSFLVLLLCFLGFGRAGYTVVTLDPFSSRVDFTYDHYNHVSEHTTGSYTILGGLRHESLESVSLSSPSAYLSVFSGHGFLRAETSQNATGTLTLTYPVGNKSPLDFELNGDSEFRVDITSDETAVPLTISVMSSGGLTCSSKQNIPPDAGHRYYSENFCCFDTDQCDFSKVVSVAFSFDLPPLSNIEILPIKINAITD